MSDLNELFNQAIWVAESLFNRRVVSGSAANLSFFYDNKIYITASSTCFGNLNKDSFAEMSLDGKNLNGLKASKEFPLHQMLYLKDQSVKAVLHTHSAFATYWSCQPVREEEPVIPSPTPYLKMKVGKVGYVPFAKPGSEELFTLFRENLSETNCYLLANHGPIVGGSSIMEAFYNIEELEEAAKNAWLLQK